MSELQDKNQKPKSEKKVDPENIIDLSSASDWKKWNLGLLGFHFAPTEWSDLEKFIHQTYTPAKDERLDERDSYSMLE